MNMKRILLSGLLVIIALCGSVVAPRAAAAEPMAFTRTEDVVYGRKFGTALTLDVIEPAQKNGFAVLWMVSGSWVSRHDGVAPASYQALLDRGYTVFAVVHGSQPRFTIPEITTDIHRAVRFVRHNAARWSIDPQKLGISGTSAGGHLSLTIATQGRPGQADALDPVDRESSVVQAVACFYPPSDFLNWTKPGEQRPLPADVIAAFGPRWAANDERAAYGKEISPAYFVSATTPPTLVIHGDADARVPLYQSQALERRYREAGVPFKLIVKTGAGHGYAGWAQDVVFCADWYDEYLRGLKPAEPSPARAP